MLQRNVLVCGSEGGRGNALVGSGCGICTVQSRARNSVKRVSYPVSE